MNETIVIVRNKIDKINETKAGPSTDGISVDGKTVLGGLTLKKKLAPRKSATSGLHMYKTCLEKKQGVFQPTDYQQRTMDAYLRSIQGKFGRGMLLYHKLGSGKTCTAIMIGDMLLEKKLIDRVYVFTPGSLRQGWYSEYCRLCGKDRIGDYVFITYNYDVKQIVERYSFDRSLVIVDEVHNLVNGLLNKSKVPVAIFKTILTSNCYTLLLSGTPVSHEINSFRFILSMLNPKHMDVYKDENYISDLFTGEIDGKLKPLNPGRVMGLFRDVISFYPGNEQDIPRVIELPPLKLHMSVEQERVYWKARFREMEFDYPPDEKLQMQDPVAYENLRTFYIIVKKRILSRKASNFGSEDPIVNKLPDTLVKDKGWIDDASLAHNRLSLYSNKITALIRVITIIQNQKHVVFTFFKTKAGVTLIHTLLKKCGISSLTFSGDMNDKERSSVLRRFNSENNLHGAKYKVLLVTEAGSEGISVLDTNNMHILESSTRIFKTNQVIGRIARYKSHSRLPVEDRYVRVWRYWSIRSEDARTLTFQSEKKDGTLKTSTINTGEVPYIDEQLYNEGMKVWNKIDSFLRFLEDASIEKSQS